jgi:hypothetical protein
MNRPLLIGLSLLLLPAAAGAEQFKYRYRPGQVIEYRASMAGAAMMGPTGAQMLKTQFRMTVKQSQRVRSVAGGVMTLEVTDTPVSGSMNVAGSSEAVPKTPTKTLVRMTERGRFLGKKTLTRDPEAGAASPLDGTDVLYGLNFPNRDIKPGDTWQDTINVGTAEKPQRVQVTWRYVGKEAFRGRNCIKVSTTISMPMTPGAAAAGGAPDPAEPNPFGAQGKLSGSVLTYFDPQAGVEVYSTGSITMVARADLSGLSPETGEFASVMKINLVQSLVPAGAAGPRR